MVHIGQTTVPVYNPENRTKVPDVLFYENQQVRIPVRESLFLYLILLCSCKGKEEESLLCMLCAVILGSIIIAI